MTTQTPDQQTIATEWHPAWCARGALCNHGSDDLKYHVSPPLRLSATNLPSNGPEGAEDFVAEVTVVAGAEYGEVFDQAAEVHLRSLAFLEDAPIHMGTETIRDLAAWLWEMAALVDQVHAGQRASLHDEAGEQR